LTRQTGGVDRRSRFAWKGRFAVRRPTVSIGRATVAGVAALAVIGSVVALAFAPGGQPDGPPKPGVATPPAGRSAAPPLPGHEVYGFVPYWEIDDTIAAHLRATDTTTVALFSITHTGKGRIATNQNGYRAISGPIGRQVVSDAHELGRRVDVTWTSFGESKNATLFASVALQDKVIASLVGVRSELGVDGIAVDVEEIGAGDIPAYGAFVGRLRTALRAADPDATVTATTGAGPQGAALALAASVAGADRIFLMGYDYRTASSQPGASAPISRGDGVERSIAWSLELYSAAGVPVDRTVLGLPLYGLSWPTASADIGSQKTGGGDIWVPRRNLATLVDPGVTAAYDPVEDVAFLAVPAGKAWRAVYYDTPRSLRPKLGLANSLGLAGAGFWALGYERGLPDYTALIGDFRAGRSMAVAAADPGASSSAGPVAGANADPLAPSLATGGAGSPPPSVVP
jgi:spore germination protein YaaH